MGRGKLTICHVALFVAVLAQLVVVAYASPDAAVVLPVVVPATGLALAASAHAADAASGPEGLEAALSRDHAGAHGRVYARGALPAPCLCPLERLEVCLVFWCDGAAVLERRHLLAWLVDVGVVVFGLFALDELRIVVRGAGEGATQARAERHGERRRCLDRVVWWKMGSESLQVAQFQWWVGTRRPVTKTADGVLSGGGRARGASGGLQRSSGAWWCGQEDVLWRRGSRMGSEAHLAVGEA